METESRRSERAGKFPGEDIGFMNSNRKNSVGKSAEQTFGSEVLELLQILKIPESEAIKALLSAFTPCQPGALRQAWANRKNYGIPPSTREMWELFENGDFRCKLCQSQHRITLDHINNNPEDNRLENLQVLCADCNRAKNERGMKHRDSRYKIYRAMIELYQENQQFPENVDIVRRAGIEQLSGATYMVRFFQYRLGVGRKLRDQNTRQENFK